MNHSSENHQTPSEKGGACCGGGKKNTRWLPWLLLGLAIAAVYGIGQFRQSAAEAADRVDWVRSYEAGLSSGAATGKPVLLEFTSLACGPCQMMKRNVFSDEQVAEKLNQQFVPVRIELSELSQDQAQTLLGKYEVFATPTYVMVQSGGEEIGRTSGYMDKNMFGNWLSMIQQQQRFIASQGGTPR